MFKDIIDFKVLSLYTKDYASSYSIREITRILKINYSHAFKVIKELSKNDVLIQEKKGQANNISFNIKNLEAVKLLGFVEENKKVENPALNLIIKEAVKIDPFSCIGLFGSRVSGKAKKDSDWDIFIISDKKEMNKIESKFPYAKNLHFEIISLKEFEESLISREETVIKHIVRNKQILFNPYPFYNIIHNWEMIKYAPTQ